MTLENPQFTFDGWPTPPPREIDERRIAVPLPDAQSGLEELPEELALAFRPLHKRAFGMAVGLTLASCMFLATAFALLVPGRPGFLDLLGNYFPGYSVTWTGAFVGFLWAFFAFFVAGWFAAFCRNFFIAASVWMARTRAELQATHDFLDHI
ncbi:MAG: hypothetical protein PVI57_11950 [Gemmatimonadota bacterium]